MSGDTLSMVGRDTSDSCSFCLKGQDEVMKLVAAPPVFICDECIALSAEIISRFKYETISKDAGSMPSPEEIKKILDQYVISQDKAKKVLSVAVYNHYKKLANKGCSDGVELQKSNILMIGPTGSGKTLLAQTLANILDVPFAIADATALTEAGYVGEDVENIVLKLLQAADYDVERAQRGVIYLDEIDKISRKSDNPSITRDVSGEGVQQALLKIIEGTVASVPPQGGRKHPQQEFLQIDTSDILFICSGSFSGLDKIIESRMQGSSIGFGADLGRKNIVDGDSRIFSPFENVETQDLIKFGLIPEFIGRLPVVVTLDDLNEEVLLEVLLKPKNALIKQYKRLFELDNIDIVFDDEALFIVVKQALEKKTGARGLRSIMETLLLELMYKVPSIKDLEKIQITAGFVRGEEEALFFYKDKELSKAVC